MSLYTVEIWRSTSRGFQRAYVWPPVLALTGMILFGEGQALFCGLSKNQRLRGHIRTNVPTMFGTEGSVPKKGSLFSQSLCLYLSKAS